MPDVVEIKEQKSEPCCRADHHLNQTSPRSALAELACAGYWASTTACGGARHKEQVLLHEERKVCG